MGTADTAVIDFGIAKQAADKVSAKYMAGETIDDISAMLANEMRKALKGEQEFVPVVMHDTGKEKLQCAFDSIADTLNYVGVDVALLLVLSDSRCPLVQILRDKITAAYVAQTADDLYVARKGH